MVRMPRPASTARAPTSAITSALAPVSGSDPAWSAAESTVGPVVVASVVLTNPPTAVVEVVEVDDVVDVVELVDVVLEVDVEDVVELVDVVDVVELVEVVVDVELVEVVDDVVELVDVVLEVEVDVVELVEVLEVEEVEDVELVEDVEEVEEVVDDVVLEVEDVVDDVDDPGSVVDEVVVVVDDGGGASPQVTQNTLCLVSAPWEPSAWIVSLTWYPCVGWGSYAPSAAVRSYSCSASRSVPPPAASSPMKTVGGGAGRMAVPVGG